MLSTSSPTYPASVITVASAMQNGTLRIGLLDLEGVPIAFDFNLVCRETMHNFKLGFRKEHANISPGILLKSFVLQSLFNSKEKLKEYDFMGISESYKLNWSKQVRQHCRVTVYRGGIDLMLYYYLRYRLKPVIEKIFPWLPEFRQR